MFFSDEPDENFRKLLNKELSHFAESSKSGVQVSKYLINTYMDKDDDDGSNNDKDLVAAAAAVVAGQHSFRKLLNKELSHFAESSKSGVQVSKYLINTYMDKDDDDGSNNDKDLVAAAAAVVAGQHSEVFQLFPSVLPLSDPSTSGCHSPQLSLFNKAKTAAMSKISGVRRLRTSSHGIPPEYGIECAKEIAVYMQR
uniref:Phosphodiesterase 4 upstream conserved regions (UCR) domain-containing protein n=1 Tax=Panagrolaimus sp. PS1159 TaxID=55785 RepID=A0AC35EWE4_9BILA